MGDLATAASGGPETFICWIVLAPLCSLMQLVLVPLLSVAFQWGTDFMTIPYVNQVIGWLTGLAVLGVIAVRVATGIRLGILREGGDTPFSFGEYVFKSLWALLLVAIMPTLCRLVISFGKVMFDYVYSSTGGVEQALKWYDMSGFQQSTGANFLVFDVLWIVLGMLATLILAVACGYQFVRRQVEMLVTSIIAPIVAVFSATENDTNQVTDLLKALFGLVCQQWLQYVLVMIAIGFGQAWMSGSVGSWQQGGNVFDTGANAQNFLFCIATYMAALTIPRLVDRYTFGSPGSRVGGIIASQAIMRFARVPRIR